MASHPFLPASTETPGGRDENRGRKGARLYSEHPGKLWIKYFILIIITNHEGTGRIIMWKIIPQGQVEDWRREGKGGTAERTPTGCDYLLITASPDLLLLWNFVFPIFFIYTDTYINYLGEVFQLPANCEFALKCLNCEILRYINILSFWLLSSPSE